MPYDAAVVDAWDEYAGEWDDQPGTRDYAQAAFDSLQRLLDGTGIRLDGASVVDFGCGMGADLIELASRNPHLRGVGYTISAEQAELSRYDFTHRVESAWLPGDVWRLDRAAAGRL